MSSNQHEDARTQDGNSHNTSAAQSAAERNRAYFSSPDQIYHREKEFLDAFAARWTDEFLAEQSWFDLSSLVSPTTPSLKLLDYACGTGMLSFAAMKLESTQSSPARPLFSQITGVDIADGMVKLFNERVAAGTISSNISIRAYRGDLVSASTKDIKTLNAETNDLVPEVDVSKPEFTSYNFVTAVLALHHFEDPHFALAKLTERLAPVGLLFICDLVPGPLEDAEDVWMGRKEAPPMKHEHGKGHSHGHDHGTAQSHHHSGHGHGHQSGRIDANDKPDTGITFSGFTKQSVEDMFVAAGLSNIKTRLMNLELQMPPNWGGSKSRMFWVVGKKAED